MYKTVFLFSILVTTQFLQAQITEVRRITETLCSPEFHGRGYVNGGDSIAANFLAAEFESIGLQPLKKSYFQSFDFQVNSFPGKMEVNRAGKELIPGVHFVVDPESRGSVTNWKPKLIHAKVALNRNALIKEIQQIKNGSAYNSIAFNFSNLSVDSIKLTYGLAQAVAEVMPVIEVQNAKFTWSVGRKQLEYPLIHVQDSIFEDGLSWKMNFQASFIEKHTSSNVVAYLPCGKKRAPTVVYSAHYDHLGRMGQSTYFPGGNDNASGTAMLLSMAKYFKEHPVKCNIIFIAFAGEEAGLVGSKYFVDHPMMKLKKIKFLINLDIMGSGEEGITAVNATEHVAAFDLLVKINEEKELLPLVKRRGPTQNSDHYWFTTKGVPAFFIYTMGPNKNYHDIHDTYENLSFKAYDSITTLLVEFTKEICKKGF